MSRAAATALAGALALVGVSACGTGGTGGTGSTGGRDTANSGSVPMSTSTPAPATRPPTRPPSTTRPPPTPTGLPDDLIVPPKSSGKKPAVVRVKGIVSGGVEAGCRLLMPTPAGTKGTVYLLIWKNGTLNAGQEVEVEGTLQPDLVTTCQQGTPLVVSRLLQP